MYKKSALLCLLLAVSLYQTTSASPINFRRDVSSVFEDIQEWARALPTKFDEVYAKIQDSLSTTFADLKKQIQSMTDETNIDKVINDAQNSLSASFDSMVKDAQDSFQKLQENSNLSMDEISKRAAEIQDEIAKTANEYADQVQQFGQDLSTKFSDASVADKFQEAAKEIEKRAQEAINYVNVEAAKFISTTSAPAASA